MNDALFDKLGCLCIPPMAWLRNSAHNRYTSGKRKGVRRAFAREVRTLPAQLRRALTYDQGQEMREYRLFTTQAKMKVYFVHPQCPCERGTNENTNGLLRQFFPAGTQFNRISRREIKRVQAILNDRPQKILNWHSPAHAFHHLLR